MTPLEAWQSLRDNPNHFLKYYPLKMAGSNVAPNNAVQLKAYGIYKRTDNVAKEKLGHLGATRPKQVIGPITRNAKISSFFMRPMGGIPPGAASHGPIQACYVPMINYNSDVYGLQNLHTVVQNLPYSVVDGSGDGLLATGQLSGCTFSWRVVGNDLYCSHVNPAGGDGALLNDDIRDNGTIAGVGGLNTYGRNDYPGANATLLGVRIGGTWRIYAQTSLDGFKTISGARRLHPHPAVL